MHPNRFAPAGLTAKALFRACLLYFLILPSAFAVESNNTTQVFHEMPPKKLAEIAAIISSVYEAYPESNKAKTQIESWLTQLPATQLVQLEKAIPVAWTGEALAFSAQRINLRGHLEHALSAHPDQHAVEKLRPDLSAFARGLRTSTKNWQKALEKSAKIKNEENRDQFLLGLLQKLDRLDSLADAEKKKDKIISRMSRELRNNVTTYQNDEWRLLWPATSHVQWAEKFPDYQGKFSILRDVAEHGDFYLTSFPEGIRFLQNFGRSATGQLPVIAESMGVVFAARDPEGFLRWSLEQKDYVRSEALGAGTEALLRRDPAYIKKITPYFANSNIYDSLAIAQEWARYDRAAAIKWIKSLPGSQDIDEAHDFKKILPAPRFTPQTASELIKKHFQKSDSNKIKLHEINLESIDSSRRTLESLTKSALPGAAPLANQKLYQQIFSMDLPSVKPLLHEFEQTPPCNAKDVMVRSYLLEQWIFLEPDKACPWILKSGTGKMRKFLPLAFSQMQDTNPLKVHAWLMQIPERKIYKKCASKIGLLHEPESPVKLH